MKILKLIIALFLLSCVGIEVYGKPDRRKKPEEAAITFKDGLVYSLPRTGVRIFVEAAQEKFFHGPFYKYAERYIGVKNAPSSDFEKWTIKSVRFETYCEPDPAHSYKAFGPVASMLCLSEEGVPLAVNNECELPKRDCYTTDFNKELEVPASIWPDLSMHSFLLKDDTLRYDQWSVKPIEEKAMEAAHSITKLRKRLFHTLAANYDVLPPDGEAYRVMVNELRDIEREYVGLFLGKSYKKVHSYVFEVVPGHKGKKSVIVFRFSPTSGVLPKDNLSGKPIMLEFIPNSEFIQKSNNASVLQNSNNTSVLDKGPDEGKSGLFYRIPANGTLKLVNGGVIASMRVTLAQYGKVTPVPENLIDESLSIKFHPVTGAIKSINRVD